MEETFDQKVVRNVQGNFAVYKTNEVVGDKSMVPNLEWAETEEVDKFFMFAKNLGAKVIYVAEGEDIDEDSGESKSIIVQVGFLHEGIMHHINYAEDDEEEDDESDEYEYIDETDEDEDEDEDEIDEQYPPKQPGQTTINQAGNPSPAPGAPSTPQPQPAPTQQPSMQQNYPPQ